MTLRHLAIAGLVALTFTPPLPAQEIVEVTGQDRPIDADLEEVFRVGVLEGESWEMLGTVRKAAFDARGNLYLFDGSGGVTGPWLDPRVLVFDADGSFVHTFGRSGQGPGEFNMPLNLAVMRDGTAIVGDLGHRAYQLFDESGAFVRMVRMEMSGLAVAQSDMHTDPGGNGVYAVPQLGGAMGRPGTDPAGVPTDHPAGPRRRHRATRHRGRGMVAASSGNPRHQNTRCRGGGPPRHPEGHRGPVGRL